MRMEVVALYNCLWDFYNRTDTVTKRKKGRDARRCNYCTFLRVFVGDHSRIQYLMKLAQIYEAI